MERKANRRRKQASASAAPKQSASLQQLLRKPLRVRLLGWLAGKSSPHTQSEIAKALSLSNAAVHYHMKALILAGVVRLQGTRAGPNGITEKLYSAVMDAKRDNRSILRQEGFFLNYTLQSIQEMHREAAAMNAGGSPQGRRMLVGCYETYATTEEIEALENKLEGILEDFHESHKAPGKDRRPVGITFGVVPSMGGGWKGEPKVLSLRPG